jgi:hypothetical protein
MGEQPTTHTVKIVWTGDDLQVKGSGTNVMTIALLEMAKALMMRKTLGPEISAGPIMAAKVPSLMVRQVDREVS